MYSHATHVQGIPWPLAQASATVRGGSTTARAKALPRRHLRTDLQRSVTSFRGARACLVAHVFAEYGWRTRHPRPPPHTSAYPTIAFELPPHHCFSSNSRTLAGGVLYVTRGWGGNCMFLHAPRCDAFAGREQRKSNCGQFVAATTPAPVWTQPASFCVPRVHGDPQAVGTDVECSGRPVAYIYGHRQR